MDSQAIRSEKDYLLHFLAMKYINSTVIPATNDHAKSIKPQWISIDLDEFLHFVGIFLSMEIFEIHGPHWL